MKTRATGSKSVRSSRRMRRGISGTFAEAVNSTDRVSLDHAPSSYPKPAVTVTFPPFLCVRVY